MSACFAVDYITECILVRRQWIVLSVNDCVVEMNNFMETNVFVYMSL